MEDAESYRRYSYLDIYGPRRRAWSGARAGWTRSRPGRSRLREASEVSRILRGSQLIRDLDEAVELEKTLEGLCFFRVNYDDDKQQVFYFVEGGSNGP